jgi:hypothetical protein
VPNRPLARPRVTRRLCGRPLAQATVSSPDSSMNYSRTSLILFSRATSSPWTTHRTVRCTTGQSGAPPDSPVNYSRTPLSSPESGLFTRTSLAHWTLSGAPPDSPVCQAELKLAAHNHLFFQFFSLFSLIGT